MKVKIDQALFLSVRRLFGFRFSFSDLRLLRLIFRRRRSVVELGIQ